MTKIEAHTQILNKMPKEFRWTDLLQKCTGKAAGNPKAALKHALASKQIQKKDRGLYVKTGKKPTVAKKATKKAAH